MCKNKTIDTENLKLFLGVKLNQWFQLREHTSSFTVGGETREKERGGREEENNTPEPH